MSFALASRTAALDREAEQRAMQMPPGAWPRRRALLIFNSKSGPRHDSLLRVRELVELLAVFNIRADVRVKLRNKQARREARKAAKQGCDVVIAAGDDGTVEAVASGLLGTATPLGIIPLGAYNNLATCLGIPTDAREACALIAAGSARALDAAIVRARGMKKARPFFETCAIGVGAVVTSAGHDLEKGRLQNAARRLPPALGMPPVLTRIDVDDHASQWTRTLLITVSNAPRAGAGLQLAPRARMDDGVLDVTVFDELQQADLATRLPAFASGNLNPGEDPRVQHHRCVKLRVRSTRPLPVAADSKLLGTTPVRIAIRPGAVLALVGPGPGLAHPPASALRVVVAEIAPAARSPEDILASPAADAHADPGRLVHLHGRPDVRPALAAGVRVAAVPLAVAIAVRVLPALIRALRRRLR